MNPEFSLTHTEIIFLIVALAATVPIVVFAWWILRELKKEQRPATSDPQSR